MRNSKPSGIIALAISIAVISIMVSGFEAQAQANSETFGQNRVQYRDFNWKFFETEHFRIYHYDFAGRQLARYVSEQVENDIKIVEQKMEGQFPRSFKIIVYNSYDDYRQTNIGRKYDSQVQDMPAGTLNFVGDKLVVYFTGEHLDLRRQIRAGMSRVVMERMLFGENIREMIKNAVLMNLPAWTVDGFIAYLVDGWGAQTNSEWKNFLEANPRAGFHELAEKNPELAGKAFWKYVSDKYGEHNMRNLLYNMQMKSSLAQGIKMTMGQKVKEAYDSTLAFYKEVYALDALNKESPDSMTALLEIPVPKDNAIIRDIKVAPRGNDVAYVEWKNGEFKIYMQKTKADKERSVILQEGRIDFNEKPDPNYPLLAWSNNGLKLAILYKKGTQTRLRIYNSLKAKVENYVIPANRFDRVLGMSFMEDDTKLVFSALKKSQTDLYEFTIRGSRMKNLTNDPWDDVQPWFVSGGSRKGILFLSNRPKPNLEVPIGVNELPTGPLNVFFYNTKTQSKELLQMSDVTTGTVTQPIQYGSENYAYLYDANGIMNKYVVLLGRDVNNMDSAYAVPVTNYTQNIISHQYNPASNQVADVVQVGDQYKVYFREMELPGVNAETKTLTPTILSATEENKASRILYRTDKLNKGEAADQPKAEEPILKSGNVFQSEFSEPEQPVQNITEPVVIDSAQTQTQPADTATISDLPAVSDAAEENDSTIIKVDSAYIKMKPEPYRLSIKLDRFSVRMDNSVLFTKYQSVAQTGGQYVNPPLGGMLTVSIDDLMENHRFTGGVRLPINFSGMAYFLQYENFKKRLDWSVLYFRTENYNEYPFVYIDTSGSTPPLLIDQLGKSTSTMLQGSVSYPFDRVRSVKLHLGLREDKTLIKAQDPLSLLYEIKDPKQYWALSRLEYIFDNTIKPSLNIYNGFRYKFYAEFLYRLNNPNGGFYNFGIDFRHYQKIYKNVIWANRLASAHSGGNQKILYHLGGVDNWMFPQYSSFVPVRPTENYAFEALATNLRGYEQNSRNGNTYAVFNSELRFPIFSTFLKRPIQSAVIRNLQAVAFVDAGSAWNGFLPNSDALVNDFILYPTNSEEVFLSIKDQTGGLGLGYGVGLRTTLFGYFLRADFAWNIEGYSKPMVHVSMGTDF